MFPKWSDWNIEYTRKGLIKHRISQALKALALAASIIGAYYIRNDFWGGLRGFQHVSRRYLKFGLLGLLGYVQRVVGRLPE
jgi:hypothetical protein